MDLVLERIQLRRPRPAAIDRRLTDRSARRTVLRSRPVRLAISLIDTPPTKCMRRISAHCSTSTNDLLLARPHQRTTRLHPHPDTDAPSARGVHFQPARGGEYSGGADMGSDSPQYA
jgi:hypothetical protein